MYNQLITGLKSKLKFNKRTVWLIVFVVIGVSLFAYMIRSIEVSEKVTPEVSEKVTPTKYLSGLEKEFFGYCLRTKPYKMNDNLRTAIDFIQNKTKGNKNFKSFNKQLDSVYNCLDIKYAKSQSELSGAEGLFYFSKPASNRRTLKILISPSYKDEDAYLNSFLLIHEINHALQFVSTEIYNKTSRECPTIIDKSSCSIILKELGKGIYDCIGNEAASFFWQTTFLGLLTKDEVLYLVNRIVQSDFQVYDPQVATMKQLTVTGASNVKVCGFDTDCHINNWRFFVSSIPAYKKQCKVN